LDATNTNTTTNLATPHYIAMLKKKIPLIPERNTLAIPDSRKTLIIPERKILDMLEKDSTALQ